MIKAIIYRPTRTAMQSGTANTHRWRMDFLPESRSYVEPLMGWTGMTDTTQELRMGFHTKEEAIEYAKKYNISYELREPQQRVIKPKSYATNFAFNKVQ
jgi:hypothetical protein